MIDSRLKEQIIRIIVAANYLKLKEPKKKYSSSHKWVSDHISLKYIEWVTENKEFLDSVTDSYYFLQDYKLEDLQFIIALMYFGREFGTSIGKDVDKMTVLFLSEYPVEDYRWEKEIIISQMTGKSLLYAYLEYGLQLLGY